MRFRGNIHKVRFSFGHIPDNRFGKVDYHEPLSLPNCLYILISVDYIFAGDIQSENEVHRRRYVWHRGKYLIAIHLNTYDWGMELQDLTVNEPYQKCRSVIMSLIEKHIPTSLKIERVPGSVRPS